MLGRDSACPLKNSENRLLRARLRKLETASFRVLATSFNLPAMHFTLIGGKLKTLPKKQKLT
jgi:hypothetical protein